MTDARFERYLRRRCEDELIERRDLSVRARARALTVVGLLEEKAADAVIDGYATVRRMRGLDPHGEHGLLSRPSSLLGELTVRRCAMTVQQPWGTATVRSLVTTDSTTDIVVEAAITDPRINDPFGHHGHGPSNGITVVDDRRKSHQAHFSGGGSDTEISGTLSISPPLRRDTAWVTLLGRRVALEDALDDVQVEIFEMPADLPVAERAARFVEHCAAFDRGPMYSRDDSVQTVIDTYVECGVLAADSPVVTGRGGGAVSSGTHGHRHHGHAHDPVTRWRLVDVTTPVFDGIRVAVTTLTSSDSGFAIEFHAGGPATSATLGHGLPFAVTADDDTGRHFLGAPAGWHSGSEGMGGSVAFDGPLAPDATRLELHIAMPMSEAVIRIPLVWDDAS